MLITLATTLGVAVLVVICLLSIGKFFVKGFEFWPPPSPDSWQHSVFRWLFRVFFVTLIVLSVLDFQSDSVWRYLIGAVLFLVGFGLAVRWTGFLGWRDAFGDPNKLKSTGPFAWSRNPIYVVSIVGMVGWGIAIGSTYVSVLLAAWAALYIAAPFLEEPWLARQFGHEFEEYKDKVPRYFRIRGKAQNRRDY